MNSEHSFNFWATAAREAADHERKRPAAVIGESVIEALRALDPVAYVRFASVYREFQDATQFKEIVEVLREEEQPQREDTGGRDRPPTESGA